MFSVTVGKNFLAKHALRNYRGGTEPLHEHTWKCEVTIAAKELDDSGCVVDFEMINERFDEIVAPITGKDFNILVFFNDFSPSTSSGRSPSAENIALYIYRELSSRINDAGRKVLKVTVWEDENRSASYFE